VSNCSGPRCVHRLSWTVGCLGSGLRVYGGPELRQHRLEVLLQRLLVLPHAGRVTLAMDAHLAPTGGGRPLFFLPVYPHFVLRHREPVQHLQQQYRFPRLRLSERPVLCLHDTVHCRVSDFLDADTKSLSCIAALQSLTTFFFAAFKIPFSCGDLTVSQDPKWGSFISSIYMLVTMLVAVMAFSAGAESAFSPLERVFEWIFDRAFHLEETKEKDQFLYQRIRRVKIVKCTELFIQIFTFILIGVVASQIAVYYEDDPAAKWTWMTSFYWSIQTATTIGTLASSPCR
jgi:Ion channel